MRVISYWGLGIIGLCFSMHGTAQADEAVNLNFEINPVISGSRPWDGTGLNSAQLDSGGGFLDMGTQILLDQGNQRMAPPDPYICLFYDGAAELECHLENMAKDTLQYSVSLPTQIMELPWIGIVLLDSDRGNLTGGADDLIGFGILLSEKALQAVQQRNPDARKMATDAEAAMTSAVQARFGTHRSLFGNTGGGALNAAKLSLSKCEYGCPFGDARLTVGHSVDGW